MIFSMQLKWIWGEWKTYIRVMTSTSWLLNSNIFSCYRPENSRSVAIAKDHSNLTHLLSTILPVVDHPSLQVVETVVKLLHCLNPFVVVQYGGFLKWWYPTTFGFPTKNDHFGVFWGYHHLRKHPYMKHQACIMCMGIPDMVKFTERWDGGMAFPARLQRLWLSVSSLAASARKK